nr:hypothetical protein [Candidatus Omnitrophota bacterium]
YWGPEELPKFVADSHFCYTMLLNARHAQTYDGSGFDDYINDYGLEYDKQHFIMGQFVYDGGQVSIPDFNSALSVVKKYGTVKSYGLVKLCVQAGLVYYDKRVEAIDLYVATQENGLVNKLNYPGVYGEKESVPVRGVSKEQFGSLGWKFLQRVKISEPTILYDGVMTGRVAGTFNFFTYRGIGIQDVDDMNMSLFSEHDLASGDFYAYYQPISGGAWTSSKITWNISRKTNDVTWVLEAENHSEAIGIDGSLSDNAMYRVQIQAKWKDETTGMKAQGVIQMLYYTGSGDPNGKTITINGTVLTEGATWNRGDNGGDGAASLSTYINAHPELGVTATYSRIDINDYDIGFVYLTAITAGTAGNAITLATNEDTDVIQLSGPTLEGGKEGAYYTLQTLWRFGISTGIEAGDPIETAQPYSLIEEYHPRYTFACWQDRRRFLLDCTLEKRYRNLLMWAEPGMPLVIPNKNSILLNTWPGEEAKGLVSINNAVLAAFDRSVHVVRMTGEPIQYDREESRIDEGVAASRSLFSYNGAAFWVGYDGIKTFTGQGFDDLTLKTFRRDIRAIIASEYSGNSSSYEGISGSYCANEKMLVWTFPHSTATLDGIATTLVGYDLINGTVILLECDKTFTYLFPGANGKLYGQNADGVYELFASSPAETNRMIWRSGKISVEDGKVVSRRIGIRCLGTMTIKAYLDMNATAALDTTLEANTVFDTERVIFNGRGDELELQVESSSATSANVELGRIELLNPHASKG